MSPETWDYMEDQPWVETQRQRRQAERLKAAAAREQDWIDRELGDVPVRIMGETCHDNPSAWADMLQGRNWNLRDDIVRPDGTVGPIDRSPSPYWRNSVRSTDGRLLGEWTRDGFKPSPAIAGRDEYGDASAQERISAHPEGEFPRGGGSLLPRSIGEGLEHG